MDATDLPALHAHLDLALRHLEAAGALAGGLTDTPERSAPVELPAPARFAINEDAAAAGLLVDRLTRVMAGASLEGEFARLFAVD